ncbi:3-keto-5-aminohexanoate cleavage protein [Aliagarivorans marinus]|uniref:3-keto-5-aminohexanoate cleavage protein n=1 Tax=Aliagarivorans marinus TaxID=561965 RepID=UPI000408D191|nr:3-keto-5-aminohexanoate cleavage protein [Aliagarivorans marinus]
MNQPIAIIVAPNGARLDKQTQPAVPISPQEIANEVQACTAAGAAMVHLHARDSAGLHSLEVADNQHVIEAVRQQDGEVIIQLTTEAVGRYQPEQQRHLIETLKPEAASVALRELLPDASYQDSFGQFCAWALQQRIFLQFILYSEQDIQHYLALRSDGIIPANGHHLLLVLGRSNEGLQPQSQQLEQIQPLIKQFGDIRWAVCAFGLQELPCLLAAAKLGGDVRIGFENNIYQQGGELALSNASQIVTLQDQLAKADIAVLTSCQMRELIACSWS